MRRKLAPATAADRLVQLVEVGMLREVLEDLIDGVDHRLRRAVARGQRRAASGPSARRPARRKSPPRRRASRRSPAWYRRRRRTTPPVAWRSPGPAAAAPATATGPCPETRRAAGAARRRPAETPAARAQSRPPRRQPMRHIVEPQGPLLGCRAAYCSAKSRQQLLRGPRLVGQLADQDRDSACASSC